MPMLDVFNDDAFSVVQLTDSVEKLKFQPGRIGQLGLFQESGVSTTTVVIEERDGILSLIAPTARGSEGKTLTKNLRTARPFVIPHFEINDAIMAEEVQNVRAWGSENVVETVGRKVQERLGIHSQSMASTQEYSRIGAVKGTVTYADSTTLNLFTEFGVSQIAEIDFDLDNASPASGALKKKCASVIRSMADELGGLPMSGVHALCGDAFWDDLLSHGEVAGMFEGWSGAREFGQEGYITSMGKTYGAFFFGGITFENYRGSVGGTSFINTDKAHFFPVGVPGLFRTYYAPADYIETVNTVGRRLYAKQFEMPNGKGVHLDTQMNALDICTRPRVLIQGKRT